MVTLLCLQHSGARATPLRYARFRSRTHCCYGHNIVAPNRVVTRTNGTDSRSMASAPVALRPISVDQADCAGFKLARWVRDTMASLDP